MKIQTETSNEDFGKDCTIVLDKMDIKAGLDNCIQSECEYIGRVTLSIHEGISTKILVIMLGGITTRWKQVVTYY